MFARSCVRACEARRARIKLSSDRHSGEMIVSVRRKMRRSMAETSSFIRATIKMSEEERRSARLALHVQHLSVSLSFYVYICNISLANLAVAKSAMSSSSSRVIIKLWCSVYKLFNTRSKFALVICRCRLRGGEMIDTCFVAESRRRLRGNDHDRKNTFMCRRARF